MKKIIILDSSTGKVFIVVVHTGEAPDVAFGRWIEKMGRTGGNLEWMEFDGTITFDP